MTNLTHTEDYKDRFSVYRWLCNGHREIVDTNISLRQAANEFWHNANNFSAKCGLISRVMIVDWTETAQLLWEYGKGYTYNGKLFKDRPILECEFEDEDDPTWQ